MWERGTRVESLLGFDVCSSGRWYLCVVCKIMRCTIAVVEVLERITADNQQSSVDLSIMFEFGADMHMLYECLHVRIREDEAGVSGNSRFP